MTVKAFAKPRVLTPFDLFIITLEGFQSAHESDSRGLPIDDEQLNPYLPYSDESLHFQVGLDYFRQTLTGEIFD